MELCITNPTKIPNLNYLNRAELPLYVSLKNTTLQPKNQNYVNSKKLSSFSRQIHFHLQKPQFHQTPFRAFAYSSSSVAIGPEKDRLPIDIEVKESPEPNSRTIVPKVAMSCEGYFGTVKRVLGKMKVMESFDSNMKKQKVTVKGNVQPY